MRAADLAMLLRERARLRGRDGWTRDEVLAYQARRPVAGWQVVDEGSGVRVLLAGSTTVDAARTADGVRAALARVGALDVAVAVNLVDAIPRTALGKAPLIRRAQLAIAGR